MTKVKECEQRTEGLLLPILADFNFELVDVEFVKEAGNWYLRAYIDKPGGITIDDCEKVSRTLSDVLDREDYIEEAYYLEVSSPGLTRPLKKAKDYDRNIGRPVDIKLFRAVEGCKEFTAILASYTDDTVCVTLEDGKELTIAKKNISLIRQSFTEEI
ncbi:MAG: ribosome maturation factor RimP [Lachnospiraceae bacterium]|nr:ribosome maturation factor RimP [Lachnospiraceae bacterium]